MTNATDKRRPPPPARHGRTAADQPLARRIIARAAGRERVDPGEIVWVDVDMAMIQDSGGPRRLGPALDRLGVGVWDVDRLSVVADHYVPGGDIAAAEIIKTTREFAQRHHVGRWHEAEGISHTLMVERAYVHPGMLYTGGDSHSCTAGVLGCLALGLGSTDMLGVIATGQTWLRVPETVRVEVGGDLPAGVSAKDLILRLIGDRGMDGALYKVLEFGGPAITAMNVEERSVLTNMCAEIGAKSGIIPADERTWAWLEDRGIERVDGYELEGAGSWDERWDQDASDLVPLVARPDTVDDVVPASEAGDVRVTRAYIGACTGAKHSDMRMAAEVLRGRTAAPDVLLQVAPASRAALEAAIADGTASVLLQAGAHILSTGCGACPGLGSGILAAGDVCISTTNRNFRGRMGSRDAQVWLASPYSVAAAAVVGRVCDPRELLEGAAR